MPEISTAALRLCAHEVLRPRLPRLAALLASGLSAAMPKKPNVLFIAVDDLNDWVGYLRPQRADEDAEHRPARRRWASAFTRSYCAAPVCNPSRAALMSGLRPSTTGVYDNGNDWRTVIPEDTDADARTFRKAGYFVCGAGKIYHEAYRRRSEWDDYLENEGGDAQGARGPKRRRRRHQVRAARLQGRGPARLEDHRTTASSSSARSTTSRSSSPSACTSRTCPGTCRGSTTTCSRSTSIELPPYLENDLDDVPPAGVKMAKPEGDHAAIARSPAAGRKPCRATWRRSPSPT